MKTEIRVFFDSTTNAVDMYRIKTDFKRKGVNAQWMFYNNPIDAAKTVMLLKQVNFNALLKKGVAIDDLKTPIMTCTEVNSVVDVITATAQLPTTEIYIGVEEITSAV